MRVKQGTFAQAFRDSISNIRRDSLHGMDKETLDAICAAEDYEASNSWGRFSTISVSLTGPEDIVAREKTEVLHEAAKICASATSDNPSKKAKALAAKLEKYAKQDVASNKEDGLDKFIDELAALAMPKVESTGAYMFTPDRVDPKSFFDKGEKDAIKNALSDDYDKLKEQVKKSQSAEVTIKGVAKGAYKAGKAVVKFLGKVFIALCSIVTFVVGTVIAAAGLGVETVKKALPKNTNKKSGAGFTIKSIGQAMMFLGLEGVKWPIEGVIQDVKDVKKYIKNNIQVRKEAAETRKDILGSIRGKLQTVLTDENPAKGPTKKPEPSDERRPTMYL
jgi:hypothetical protein